MLSERFAQLSALSSVVRAQSGLVLLLLWASANSVFSQQATVPDNRYHLAMNFFYAGEYDEAMKGFRQSALGGVRTPQWRWVDAVCYETMIGECFFHMGDNKNAIDHYNAAIQVYLANPDWMSRIQATNQVRLVGRNPGITWGPSPLPLVPAQYPDTLHSVQVSVNAAAVVQDSAIQLQSQLYPINFVEVVRCMTLAMYRRHDILGPVAEFDTLLIAKPAISHDVEPELRKFPTTLPQWARPMIGVMHAMAVASNGGRDEALQQMEKHLSNGQFDHPLTGLGLLMLGKLSLEKGELDKAKQYFYASTFSGAHYLQGDVVEEGFLHAVRLHTLQGEQGAFAPLELATAWANRERLRRLQVSLVLSAAENAAILRNWNGANGLLTQAQRGMVRTAMLAGDVGGRAQYLSAQVAAGRGNQKQLAAAQKGLLTYLKRSSRYQFRTSVTELLAKADAVSDRQLNELYQATLSEPVDLEWEMETAESYGRIALARLPELESWFALSLRLRAYDKAAMIHDQMRRTRYWQTQPDFGRQLSLRWLIEGPEAALSKNALKQKQTILGRYPELKQWSDEIKTLKAELAKLPASSRDTRVTKQTTLVGQQIAKLSEQQEAVMQEIVYQPESFERTFPPTRTVDDIQSTLQPGQTVLYLMEYNGQLYSLWISAANNYDFRNLGNVRNFSQSIPKLLQAMGNYDANYVLDVEHFAKTDWETEAYQLQQQISGRKDDFWNSIQELIVVPDGELWHLPFEALLRKDGDEMVPLTNTVKIRYVPTLGLGQNDSRPLPQVGVNAIVVGRPFDKNSGAWAAETAVSIRNAMPKTIAVTSRMALPSHLAKLTWRTLITLDDIDDSKRELYAWSPTQVDKGKPGSRILDWSVLPFGGASQVVLPAFHTAAETGLKASNNGEALMLDSLQMMAAGTRTILLSRWRTGGKSSLELVREFVQELPNMAPSAAWQRSVALLRSLEVDPLKEPRIKEITTQDVPSSQHPFFWAGYLLIDTGVNQPPQENGQ
ncbi:MAG: CHAT domain-containing protein [Planctomycetales bacterium]|nr:CHAT domain-containing protein [Planctomycetales bacterium]